MTAARRSGADRGRSAPRLYLVTPPLEVPRLAAQLAEAIGAADVAAVLARPPAAGDANLIEQVRAIAPAVQDRGVAFLIEAHPEIVDAAGADGAHVSGTAAFDAALPL